jgi:hypothetical protein
MAAGLANPVLIYCIRRILFSDDLLVLIITSGYFVLLSKYEMPQILPYKLTACHFFNSTAIEVVVIFSNCLSISVCAVTTERERQDLAWLGIRHQI